jgi:hypothetical protein
VGERAKLPSRLSGGISGMLASRRLDTVTVAANLTEKPKLGDDSR